MVIPSRVCSVPVRSCQSHDQAVEIMVNVAKRFSQNDVDKPSLYTEREGIMQSLGLSARRICRTEQQQEQQQQQQTTEQAQEEPQQTDEDDVAVEPIADSVVLKRSSAAIACSAGGRPKVLKRELASSSHDDFCSFETPIPESLLDPVEGLVMTSSS